MIRIAWRSLTAHKLRTILTTLAILLGVAMISGTYVLTDQIDRGFKEHLQRRLQGHGRHGDAEEGRSSSARARPAPPRDCRSPWSTRSRPSTAWRTAVGYVDGDGRRRRRRQGRRDRRRADPVLLVLGQRHRADATYIEGGAAGAERRGGGHREAGHRPRSSTSARRSTVDHRDRPRTRRACRGIFTSRRQSSLGGSLLIDTTLAGRAALVRHGGPRQRDRRRRRSPASRPRRSPQRVRAALPADGRGQDRRAGRGRPDRSRSATPSARSCKPALLAFGGIAVLVGAFIIFNAFSMTVAQRRREFAMLRALGATRAARCCSASAGEALVMGVLASVVGLFAGLGVAAGVNQVFKAAGVDIPRGGLVLRAAHHHRRAGRRRRRRRCSRRSCRRSAPRACRPWRRCRRAPSCRRPASRASRPSWAAWSPCSARCSSWPACTARRQHHDRAWRRSPSAPCCVFVAVAMLSKYVVRPLAGVLGWPLQKLAPVSGRLARDNSRRNPGAHGRSRRPR